MHCSYIPKKIGLNLEISWTAENNTSHCFTGVLSSMPGSGTNMMFNKTSFIERPNKNWELTIKIMKNYNINIKTLHFLQLKEGIT